MEERAGQLTAGAGGANLPAADPDKTLVQPRFDMSEEKTAQPVVPLAPSTRGGRRLGGSLPIMIILVSAVVGGLVSVLAYRAYQRRPAQPAAQDTAQQQQQQQKPAEEAAADESPTPELLVVAAQAEDSRPTAQQQPEAGEADTNVAEAVTPVAARPEREDGATAREARKSETTEARKPETTTAPERAPRRTTEAAKSERASEPPRSRRVDVITGGAVGERVSRRERARDDSEIEGQATDYETPAERRARRRAARQSGRRNVDRVRAIFEGDPPRLD